MPLIHEILYSPHGAQKPFHKSTKFINAIIGGLGMGKTHALVMRHLKNAAINKGLPAGLMCPDLKMFKRDVMPTFMEICDQNNIPFKTNLQDYTIRLPTFGSTTYVFHDQDKGKSIRGPNLAFGSVNEVTLCSQEGFDAFLGRMRLGAAKLIQVCAVGTPESFDWFHERYVSKPKDDVSVFHGSTYENKHLNPNYVKNLENSYDELMIKQFLHGQAVNLNGKAAAWAFDRSRHVVALDSIEMFKNTLPIWVALDFNVNPMSATLFYRLPDGMGPKLYAFKSIKLRDSNTFELANVLKQEIGDNPCVVYPDPAGAHRSTSSQISDIQILRDNGFNDVRYKKSIRSVRDCLNAMNAMMGRNEILFHPDCVDAIKDLERCVLKDSGEIDKSKPELTHWLDGIKNMVDYEFPIVRVDSRSVRISSYA